MTPRAARVFGGTHALTGLLVACGVFRCLPVRWLPVDVAAGALVVLETAAAAGLLGGAAWGKAVARATSFAALGAGLSLVTVLAVTASWLAGVYGPVGAGGATLLVLVAALALPYLVVLPCVEIIWLGGREAAGRR